MDERNATASWSGYLHQGKVGIFVSLKKINELINKPNQDLSKWKVEYESAEDIDIKNGSVVDSRHQVKAYKEAKYPNDYKDVLGILKYRIDSKGKKVIENKGFRICDFDKDNNPLDIEVNENSRFLHTITETLGFNLTEEEFKKQFKLAKYNGNPNKIRLFRYPSGNEYCRLVTESDELIEYCILEITKIMNFEQHPYKDNYDHKKGVINNIISNLDREIRKKHSLGGDEYPQLCFKDIYELIVSTQFYKKLNIDSLREALIESWISFIGELNVNKIEYNKIHERKIESIVRAIYLLDDVSIIQFMKNINPDENEIGNIDTVQDVTKLCKIDNLKDVFYECLIHIKQEEFLLSEIGYEKDGGYVLTAINRKPSSVKSVIKAIMENSNITNKIFDKSYLINGLIDDIQFCSILDNIEDENELNNNWGKLATKSDNFYNPKMKFISVEKLKEKLNRV